MHNLLSAVQIDSKNDEMSNCATISGVIDRCKLNFRMHKNVKS